MQVGVRTLNLLNKSTDLQQSKYMLGYVDYNLIGVLPTDLYPQFMCLKAHFCAQVSSQYATYTHHMLTFTYTHHMLTFTYTHHMLTLMNKRDVHIDDTFDSIYVLPKLFLRL